MSRISDAFAVLMGSKLAAPPELFSVLAEATTALDRAQRQHPMNKAELGTLKTDADQSAENSLAVTRIKAISIYLQSLPALFAVILRQLEDLRGKARLFDEERLAFLEVKNGLQAKADELEALIGGAFEATTAADAADDAATPVETPPVDPSGTGATTTTPPVETPETTPETAGPADAGTTAPPQVTDTPATGNESDFATTEAGTSDIATGPDSIADAPPLGSNEGTNSSPNGGE